MLHNYYPLSIDLEMVETCVVKLLSSFDRNSSAGGDSQIGAASAIPLRRQGQAMLAMTALAVLR